MRVAHVQLDGADNIVGSVNSPDRAAMGAHNGVGDDTAVPGGGVLARSARHG